MQSVNGPMSRSLKDICFFSEVIVSTLPWLQDPRCLPIPWRQVEKKPRLKLAVMWHDGCVLPTPPVTRALKETVKKLEAAGHEIVQWEPDGHRQLIEILVSISFCPNHSIN